MSYGPTLLFELRLPASFIFSVSFTRLRKKEFIEFFQFELNEVFGLGILEARLGSILAKKY